MGLRGRQSGAYGRLGLGEDPQPYSVFPSDQELIGFQSQQDQGGMSHFHVLNVLKCQPLPARLQYTLAYWAMLFS